MIYFSPAKLNLGLQVLNRRLDGYHNLESLFITINWQDIIEIRLSKSFRFIQTGLSIPLKKTQINLVLRAFKLLQTDYQLPACYIHLHKLIPSGSGLGGGSSNATTTLLALNTVFNLNLDLKTLKDYAAVLGSDCPFFVEKIPQLVTGRGDLLEPYFFKSSQIIKLKSSSVVVIFPALPINTAWAFDHLKSYQPITPRTDNYKQPLNLWKNTIENDFESSIFKHYPELKKIKTYLYKRGAIYASLTGTGSAIYGVFENPISLDNFAKYTCWQGKFLNLTST